MKIGLYLKLLFYFNFSVFILSSCNQNPSSNAEFENLKGELFKKVKDISELPIYADPPTQDYNDFKKGIFLFQIDSTEIKKIKKYRKELEPYILQYIDSGYSWIYLAAFLHYKSAVPKIRNLLLKCNKFYGWEGGDYSKIERYLDDEQYCYQLAYIAAIEHISKKNISLAITLSEKEYNDLKIKADKCKKCNKDALAFCYARWMLKKLKVATF